LKSSKGEEVQVPPIWERLETLEHIQCTAHGTKNGGERNFERAKGVQLTARGPQAGLLTRASLRDFFGPLAPQNNVVGATEFF